MKKLTVIVLAIFLTTSVLAHEYVLVAYQYLLNKGDKIELHLFVTDGFNVEMERPMQKARTLSYGLISENGSADLLPISREGAYPILYRAIDFKGLGLIHMERDYAKINMKSDKFKSYLRAENIENIEIKDASKKHQRERYTRYIKSLIQSNPKQNDDLYKKVLGHKLEIVFMQNPYELNLGDWIHAKVLFEGKPLTNKVITARNRLGNQAALSQFARTNEEGICSFKLERRGDWFFHTTHMLPSPDKVESDWDSFWTSFSFGFYDRNE